MHNLKILLYGEDISKTIGQDKDLSHLATASELHLNCIWTESESHLGACFLSLISGQKKHVYFTIVRLELVSNRDIRTNNYFILEEKCTPTIPRLKSVSKRTSQIQAIFLFFAVQQYREVMDEKLHLGLPNYLLAVLSRKIFSDISDAAFGALCGTKYKGNSKNRFFRLYKEIQAYGAPCKPGRNAKMKPTVRISILD